MHRHDDLQELQKLLGVKFRDVRLLDRARTDESAKQWCSECKKDEEVQHNRIPEWVGDSVLEVIVRMQLVHILPDEDAVGRLDDLATKLTRNRMLGLIGLQLGIGPFVHLADDRFSWWGTCDLDIIANTMEALIWAIMMDRGGSVVKQFVLEHVMCWLDPETREVETPMLPMDELAKLQQELGAPEPEYLELNGGKRNEQGLLESTVWENGKLLGRGTGITLEDARQEAARQALQNEFE